jgi:hypothetical protein
MYLRFLNSSISARDGVCSCWSIGYSTDHKEENGAEPTISLAPLTSIQPHTGRTMHATVLIGNTWLHAQLDSGSTHTFIATAIAECTSGAELHVAVANGDCLTSPGRCSALDIVSEHFIICCYELGLGSLDMVLGVQWLESLGLMLWDIGRQTLVFVHNGRHVHWSAVPNKGSERLASSPRLWWPHTLHISLNQEKLDGPISQTRGSGLAR